MLIELITAFAAAIAGAGTAMLVRHMSGKRLPRIMIPLCAGLAMISVTIWNEYSWYTRTADTLPEDVVVVSTFAEPYSFRPWTYAMPYVSRFMAVDTAAIRLNQNVPDQRMAEVFLFKHRAPIAKLPMLIDCAAGARADIADGMEFNEEGAVINADWQDLAEGDPLLAAVCS